MQQEKLNLFVVILWSLWKARNTKVWKHKVLGWRQIAEEGKSMLGSWIEAQRTKIEHQARESTSRWRKPPEGSIKVNVDAALGAGSGRRAWAWVARNAQGDFLAGGSQTVQAKWTAAVTEAIGVREVIRWIKEQRWQQVKLETYSMMITSGIMDREGDSYFDTILEDIRHILHNEVSIEVTHCK
ncbi:unnamed protein product, partial [Cuscuta epithymum]